MTKIERFFYNIKHNRKWYMEKFLKIRNKKSELVPFQLNPAQLIVEEKMKWCERTSTLKRFIVLKARQMGLSTYFEATIFHDTSTNSFKNSMIIAHEDKATQNLFQMSKLYYEELPDAIRPMKRFSNEKALTFENGTSDESEKQRNPGLRSKITVATANTVDTGRSATIHNLHASEVAFFPNAKTTMLGLLQCVPDEMNTLVVLESTANGVGDYFHSMWNQAVKGENEFIPIFLAWFTDPTYTRPFRSEAEKNEFIKQVDQTYTDTSGKEVRTYEYNLKVKNLLTYEQLNWRRWTIKNKCAGDEELFMQEYPSTPEEAFISSGRPKFNIGSLKKYQTICTPPIKRGYLIEKDGEVQFIDDEKGYIHIWEEPIKDKYYAIGADVAEGLIHGDYSVGAVGTEEFDVVALWHGHIDPDLFGDELYKLGKYYNKAYIGVESNNHGLTTLKRLQHREYWDIYYQKTYDKISDQLSTKMGWGTTNRTKPMMIDKLAEFVREQYLGLHSDMVIGEMYTYIIEDNGSTNAQSGCNDDCVMAIGILLQLLLEGKSENYIPETPFDQIKKGKNINSPDVIDPLFEGGEGDEISV